MSDADRSELRGALARLDIQVLTAGVLLQAALLPVILYGRVASREGSPFILAATYALEAVLSLSMVAIRSRRQNRALQVWQSSTLAHAISGVLRGP